ncbi:MAG: outer membrane lipid asymmetry maintenance protein MlaD [Gammaproteobacteria bacterium]|nr:outer membrane lipid asymmetry maintenance protein MlaD [Gammaproteobacteria bacterium]
MLSQRTIETSVGLFLLAAFAAFVVLAFRVSGLTSFFQTNGYHVVAQFDDIGQLKVRSAVKIDGVNIGEVSDIYLDPTTFKAVVTLRINESINQIPDDSTAAILTAGLLGDNYIAITPMYSENFLKNGSAINETHSAMILEKLIGQFLFNIGKSTNTKNDAKSVSAH